MVCSRCNTENRPDARFCVNCGLELPILCLNCGEMLPTEAKFCLNCGQQVALKTQSKLGKKASTIHSGERRIVTILFADISGFTDLSEYLDPEQLRNLMNDCFDHLVPVIEKFGGVVDKFIGQTRLQQHCW